MTPLFHNFFEDEQLPKRLVWRRSTPILRTSEGEEAETFREVSGLEQPGKLTGYDDLDEILKEQDALAEMSLEQFRVDYGFDGQESDIGGAKVEIHKKLTEEFQKRITEDEKKGLNAFEGIDPNDLSDLKSKLDSELGDNQNLMALGGAQVAQVLQEYNKEAELKVNDPRELSIAYLQHKLNQKKLEHHKKALGRLRERISKSHKTKEELEEIYNTKYEDNVQSWKNAKGPSGILWRGLAIVGLPQFGSWISHQGRRLANWWNGKDYTLQENVFGTQLKVSALVNQVENFKSVTDESDAKLTSLRSDIAYKQEMAKTLHQAIRSRMKDMQIALLAVNRKLAKGSNTDLEEQRNELIKRIKKLSKADKLAEAMSRSADMVLEKAEEGSSDIMTLEAISQGIDENNLQKAYKRVAERNKKRTKDAREELGPMNIQEIKEDVTHLTWKEIKALSEALTRLGRNNRHPEKEAKLTKRTDLKDLRDHFPRVFAMLEQMAKMPPKDLMHNKIYRNLVAYVGATKDSAESNRLDAHVAHRGLDSSVREQLKKKRVLMNLVDEDFLAIRPDFFSNDFASDSDLRKYIKNNADSTEMKAWLELMEKLTKDANGRSELIILPSGEVRTYKEQNDLKTTEVEKMFDNDVLLAPEMAKILKKDPRKFKSLCLMLGVANAGNLPESATAASLKAYLYECTPEQLDTVVKGVHEINTRCLADGKEIVRAETKLRREAFEAFEGMKKANRKTMQFVQPYILANPDQALPKMHVLLMGLNAVDDTTPFNTPSFPAGKSGIREFINDVTDLQDLIKLKDIFSHAAQHLVSTDIKDGVVGRSPNPADFNIETRQYYVEKCTDLRKSIEQRCLTQGAIFDTIEAIYTANPTNAHQDILPLMYPKGSSWNGQELKIEGKKLEDIPDYLPYVAHSLEIIDSLMGLSANAPQALKVHTVTQTGGKKVKVLYPDTTIINGRTKVYSPDGVEKSL